MDVVFDVVESSLIQNNLLSNVQLTKDYANFSVVLKLKKSEKDGIKPIISTSDAVPDAVTNFGIFWDEEAIFWDEEAEVVKEEEDCDELMSESANSSAEQNENVCSRISQCSIRLTRLESGTVDKLPKVDEVAEILSNSKEEKIPANAKGETILADEKEEKSTSKTKEGRKNGNVKQIRKKSTVITPVDLRDICVKQTKKSKSSNHSLKRYKCILCDYTTNKRCSMINHRTTHFPEKPVACSLCNFRCKRQDLLEKHMRVHTKEKRFQCKLCDFATTHEGNLKNHKNLVHSSKVYYCDLCDY